MSDLPKDPARAMALWTHLASWGEVGAHEAAALGAADWLPLLEQAEVVAVVADAQDRPLAWHLTAGFNHLLDAEAHQAARRICFAVPSYRAYLVGVLAEGLLDAARAGMVREIEDWTAEALAALIPEINALLDGFEGDQRLVDRPAPELEQQVRRFPGRDGAFAVWDLFALGQTAQPKALFEFALRRFAPAGAPLPTADAPPALLRALPLNREDGFAPDTAPLPSAWNTRRLGVPSGAPLFDARGQCLCAADRQDLGARVEQLRDALVGHPFYAAVIQLTICAWRSPASAMPRVELYLPAAGALHDLSVLVGSRGAGRLADLLGDLVRAQGYTPFGLVEGRVPDALMGNLLRNLLELCILRHQDEQLVLDEGYQSSLMAARLRTVFRPGKALQERMVEVLEQRAAERAAV